MSTKYDIKCPTGQDDGIGVIVGLAYGECTVPSGRVCRFNVSLNIRQGKVHLVAEDINKDGSHAKRIQLRQTTI